MADVDPAEVMRSHNQHGEAGCFWTAHLWGGRCEPYRLAEALTTEQARTSRIRALRDAANYAGTNRVYCSDISEALNPQDPPTPDPYLRSIDA